MAITVKQQSAGATATGTALATAFSSSTGTGNGIVVCVGATGADATSITDPASNTYTEVVTANFFGSPYASVWFCGNPTGFSGSVTAHFAGSTEAAIVAAEVFGVLSVDTSNGANANGTNAQPGAITTAAANRILFGCLRDNTITGSPSGFTSLYRADNTDACYEVVTSVQTALNIQWANSTGGYAAVVVAFASTITTSPVPAVAVELGTVLFNPIRASAAALALFQYVPLPVVMASIPFQPQQLWTPTSPMRASPAALAMFQPRPLALTRPNVGPGRGLQLQLVRKTPDPAHPDFLRRIAGGMDEIADRLNDLVRNGNLRKDLSSTSPIGNWVLRAGAHADVRNPGPADDQIAGFVPGSAWLNKTTGKMFFCWTNTPATATWVGPIG